MASAAIMAAKCGMKRGESTRRREAERFGEREIE